jgi:hypothetical protein
VAGKCISLVQTTFIQGRFILDGVVYCGNVLGKVLSKQGLTYTPILF